MVNKCVWKPHCVEGSVYTINLNSDNQINVVHKCDYPIPFVSGGKHCTTEPITITDAVRDALARASEATNPKATSTEDIQPQEDEAAPKVADAKQTVAEATASTEKPAETKEEMQRDKI